MSERESEARARFLGVDDCSTGCWLLTLLGLYGGYYTVLHCAPGLGLSFQNGVRFNFGFALLGLPLFARASLCVVKGTN